MALVVVHHHHPNASLAEMDQVALTELYNDNDNDDSSSTTTTEVNAPPTTHNNTHGGLENLGNTCYMASALQMLTSATGFMDSLDDDDDEAPLRHAVVDLTRRLMLGETVRPELLKIAIDQRSPLFHGFRQQDANELLVTLLDLLDEEYKKYDSPATIGSNSVVAKESMDESFKEDDTIDERSTTTTVDATLLPDDEDINVGIDDHEDDTVTVATSSSDSTISEESLVQHQSSETTAKKARFSEPEPTSWRPSFSSFSLDDIGRLLHGDPSDALILPDISTTCIGNEPQYKLVGGRMNTSDVILKPYQEYENESSLQKQLTTTTVTEYPSAVESTVDTTPIDSYFKTSIRVKLTCDSCKYSRRHTETFWQLSLEIGSDHVEDGLRRFFAPCQQDIKCEKCFSDTATQTMELEELPPYLLLHFKRFIVDVSPDYSSVSYRKDGSPVYFNDTLSLSDDYAESLLEQTPEYSLISVVHHIGASANCGHYTADAKRDGVWMRFNDEHVECISETEAIEQSRHTAYMVLYQLNSGRR